MTVGGGSSHDPVNRDQVHHMHDSIGACGADQNGCDMTTVLLKVDDELSRLVVEWMPTQ